MSEERWKAAAHAVQSGVAAKMNIDATDTEPKHLRTGINVALADGKADDAGETVSDDKPDHVHAPANYELDDDEPQLEPLTPREIAIIAAGAAMFNVVKIIRDDGALLRSALLPSRPDHLELFDILDLSPDLPVSAIAQQLDKPDLPEAAVEALRAAYVGMQGWVKAEEARRAPPPAPLLRKGRYEKSGRVDPAPERVVSPTEAERMRRNRAASED